MTDIHSIGWHVLHRQAIWAAAIALALSATPAGAQNETGIRAQHQDVTGATPPTGLAPAPQQLVDPRAEMRKLVQEISSYARKFNRNFVVVVEDGLDLFEVADGEDPEKRVPATGYLRSIDGVLINGLYYIAREARPDDAPNHTPEETNKEMLRAADLAKRQGIRILVNDYADNVKNAQASYRKNAAKGFIPFVAVDSGFTFNDIPGFPRRPFRENAESVRRMSSIRNYLRLRDTSGFGQQEAFAAVLRKSNFDAVIVDVFHRPGEPFRKEMVRAMKFKHLGAARLVLASMNVGTAERRRYYWKKEWREGTTPWIAGPAPGDGNYFVKYWDPSWQKVITGTTESYIYGIVMQEFDGVLLEGVGSYRAFEGGE